MSGDGDRLVLLRDGDNGDESGGGQAASPVMVRVLRAITPGGSRVRALARAAEANGEQRVFQVIRSGYGEVGKS